MKRIFISLAILLTLSLFILEPNALAAGDVNECNETSFMLALESGGLVKLNCSGIIVLTSEVSVEHDTTIDGTGQDVQFTTAGNSRIFQILGEELKVKIKGVTLQGGLARTSGGGAILNRGNLTIENARFVENRVETGIGGAIHNDGGTLNILNTEFTSNRADNGGSGGAVANSNAGVLIIEGGSFNANEATSTTNGRGGAIYGISGKGTITITDTHFNDNVAHGNTEGGGAIYDDGPSEIIIEGGVFSYNSAPNANGGAIYNKGVSSTTSIRRTRFDNNSAPMGHGGALYAASSSEIAIGHSAFELNSAEIGGAIHISSPANTVVIVSETSFNENSASYVDLGTPQGGGAISNNGTLTITRSTLTKNTAPDGSGGAINNLLRADILNTTLTHNSASLGGAIRTSDGAMLNVSYSTIVSNSTSPGRGAGIDSGDSASAQIKVKNSIAANSTTGQDCYSSTLQAFGTNFDTDGSCSGFRKVEVADLQLGDLANNRGNTESIAIDGRSIAVDAAVDCTDLNNEPVEVDQRGVPRAQGPACDVGAYEMIDNPVELNIRPLSPEVAVSVQGKYAVPFRCGETLEEGEEASVRSSYQTEIEIVFPERSKFLGIFPRPKLTAHFVERMKINEISIDFATESNGIGLLTQMQSGSSFTLSCDELVGMPTQLGPEGQVAQSLNQLIEAGDYFAGNLFIESERTELRVFVTERITRTEIVPEDADYPAAEPEQIEERTPIYPEFVEYDRLAALEVSHDLNNNTAASAGVVTSQSPVKFSTQSYHGRAYEFRAQSATTREVAVEIYSLSGKSVYRDQTTGNSLMWRMRDNSGNVVANGVYLYVVTAVDAQGNLARSGVKKLLVIR